MKNDEHVIRGMLHQFKGRLTEDQEKGLVRTLRGVRRRRRNLKRRKAQGLTPYPDYPATPRENEESQWMGVGADNYEG